MHNFVLEIARNLGERQIVAFLQSSSLKLPTSNGKSIEIRGEHCTAYRGFEDVSEVDLP